MGWLLSEPKRRYIEAAKTDVMATWRKHGFVPPSETKVDFKDCLDMLNSLTIREKKEGTEQCVVVPATN